MESILDFFSNLDLTTIVTGTIIVGFAIVLILLEKKFPYTKGQRLLREGFFNDLVQRFSPREKNQNIMVCLIFSLPTTLNSYFSPSVE